MGHEAIDWLFPCGLGLPRVQVVVQFSLEGSVRLFKLWWYSNPYCRLPAKTVHALKEKRAGGIFIAWQGLKALGHASSVVSVCSHSSNAKNRSLKDVLGD